MSVFVRGYVIVAYGSSLFEPQECLLVPTRLRGLPTLQRIRLEHEISWSAHSTLNLNECSKHLLILLSSSDNLQAYRSISEDTRSVHVMDESILRVNGCVVRISDIQIRVDRGHWEHDTRVV
jgi:hypothetical protein